MTTSSVCQWQVLVETRRINLMPAAMRRFINFSLALNDGQETSVVTGESNERSPVLETVENKTAVCFR